VIRPRVLLADDHEPLLEAFRTLLLPHCDVLGAVTDGLALVAVALSSQPDVIVMDMTMSRFNGIEATRQLKRDLPATRIVFLTTNEETDLAAEAFRAGASGYLLKRSARSELLTAVCEVMAGRFYVTPLVTERLGHSVTNVARPSTGD
jgi:DNA-binding NarL/FixJ family response regulator